MIHPIAWCAEPARDIIKTYTHPTMGAANTYGTPQPLYDQPYDADSDIQAKVATLESLLRVHPNHDANHILQGITKPAHDNAHDYRTPFCWGIANPAQQNFLVFNTRERAKDYGDSTPFYSITLHQYNTLLLLHHLIDKASAST